MHASEKWFLSPSSFYHGMPRILFLGGGGVQFICYHTQQAVGMMAAAV